MPARIPARVPVGRTAADPLFRLLVLLAFIGLIVAGLFSSIGLPPDKLPYFVAPGLLLTAAAVGRRVWLHAGRRWLTPAPDGFEYESARGRFRVRDADVSALACEAGTVHENGEVMGRRRAGTLTLTVRGQSVPLPFAYQFPPGAADPLAPLFDRLHAGLLTRARQTLSEGGAVAGDRWRLTAGEVRFGGGTALPVDRVAGAELAAGAVCVWEVGEPEPAFRTPAGGPNALLLLDLIGSPAAEPAPPTVTPPPAAWGEEVPLTPAGDGLGRLLHERDRSLTPELRLALFAAAGLALALTAYAGQAVYQREAGKVELYLLFLGPLGAFGAGRWAGWRHVSRLRVHAHGVSYTSPRGTTELRYADVGAVTYHAVRSYTNGVYQGTNATLTLAPADPRGGGPITVHAVFQNEDAGLDAACDEACRAVAGRMLGELVAGRPVPWAAGLTLTPDGVQPRRGEPIPYHRLAWQTANGTLTLRADGRKLAAVGDDEPNFFPGALVLERMFARAEAGATA